MSALLTPPLPSAAASPPVRLRLRLGGAVQGVGFRPHCAQLAARLGLSGWVRNDSAGLCVEVQGSALAVRAFVHGITREPPPLARIAHWEVAPCEPQAGEAGFRILASEAAGAPHSLVPADAAPCGPCLDELFDPASRRHRHPFINCTHCGPRFTLTENLPYDRPHTSMAGFRMCPACEAEYREPADRRFHAQPVACPDCGPRLALWDAAGRPIDTPDPLAEAASRLKAGQVLSVKGVGGFHLVCDAFQPAAVARLRNAKTRRSKPFAVMTANAASARQWVHLGAQEQALLESPARPVLLLPLHEGVAQQAPDIAPGLNEWGLMLPSNPLHWLLFHEWLGRPAGRDWREAAQGALWVVTSANPAGEPLVADEREAVERLAGLADAHLVHERAIVARCDDSVRRPLGRRADGGLHAPFVRRARGYVPEPIELRGVPADAPPVLACGAWLKNTVCVTRGNEAFLSPHIGDLGSAASCEAHEEAVRRLVDFLGVRPRAVAHDLHPDFFSTRHALALADEWQVPAVAVQHHHAHAAAVAAEHGERGPLLALVLDGVGLGTDGTAWGGELLALRGMKSGFERLSHLPLLALPGGDRATQEPWRVAAGVLHALGRGAEIATRFQSQPAAATVAQMLVRGLNVPPTSSAGRLFDAAAALLGISSVNDHEAAAAMALEARAARHGAAEPWSAAWRIDAQGGLELHGLWSVLLDVPLSHPDTVDEAAARLHATLAAAFADWVRHHAEREGLATVALGGGCLINRPLREGLVERLVKTGLRVLESENAPPGDGGIVLGQAAVALHEMLLKET